MNFKILGNAIFLLVLYITYLFIVVYYNKRKAGKNNKESDLLNSLLLKPIKANVVLLFFHLFTMLLFEAMIVVNTLSFFNVIPYTQIIITLNTLLLVSCVVSNYLIIKTYRKIKM